MNIAKNYIFNVIYQIVTLFVGLVTVPYISRVLGSSGVGINAYTNSIIQYFILAGTIGISLYGNRAIAYVRDDKQKLSRVFWGIFVLKLITTCLAYLIFLLFLSMTKEYSNIFLIQSLYIIAATFDISWLYMGLEDFKKTVIRNLFVQIIGLICIFIFVKHANGLWIYVMISALSQLFGQLTMWAYLPKTVQFIKLKWNDIMKHFMPSLSLFIPQIAIQIYLVLNKTMLGVLSNKNEVGYFYNSDKVVRMILTLVTAMGVVMLPRVAHTFAKGNFNQVKEYLYQSFDFASYLSVPMMFGIAGIAGTMTPWFFGPGFAKTGVLIVVISPIIVLIAWSNVLGQQYLMPVGKVREYTISVGVGAVVNFILNLCLIKFYLSVGTAIATVFAELSVTLIQIIFVVRVIQIRKLFTAIWKYLIAGFFMYGLIEYLAHILPGGPKTTFIQILTGIVTYFSLLFLLRSEMNHKIFGMGLQIVKKVTQYK
ncbi:flippase [Sporolactobacillus pectinivorans]|uniref:flippase n=1 Tax=Sporolactobacillus pectinivorans TaxID=1591408 RepID=UPI000C266B69|nr:flippase [Sporolactobacillus pectinivorans]